MMNIYTWHNEASNREWINYQLHPQLLCDIDRVAILLSTKAVTLARAAPARHAEPLFLKPFRVIASFFLPPLYLPLTSQVFRSDHCCAKEGVGSQKHSATNLTNEKLNDLQI